MTFKARTMLHRTRSGFTLIELLVVIGIILLLVALTLTVGTGVLGQSDVRETQNTLRLLEIAVQEWEMAADRQVQYGFNDEPCDDVEERYEMAQVTSSGAQITANHTWSNETGAFDDAEWTTDRLWATLSRTTTVRDMIARVNAEFVKEDEVTMAGDDALSGDQSTFHFIDNWGRKILAVLPGRPHVTRCRDGSMANEPYVKDPDGTIRTAFENRFGVAADRRIYFVSAGPDGVFGNLHLNVATADLNANEKDDIADASDNIYSYPVQIEQARPQP